MTCPAVIATPSTRAARALVGALVSAAVCVLAACGPERDPAGDAALASDSALARDLSLAGAPGRAPALGDSFALADTALAPAAVEPARPAPAAPTARPAPEPRAVAARPAPRTPAPAEPAPVPVAAPATTAADAAAAGESPAAVRGLAAGTALALSTTARVCSETTRPGDRLVATLAEAARGPDGVELPAGTEVVLELAAIQPGGDAGGARVEFLVRGASVGGTFVPIVADAAPVEAGAERRAVDKPAGQDRGKVVQGAVVGAILGRVLGGGAKGTVIGAAAGAAAGAARASAATRHEVCVPAQTPVRARLVQPLALP